MNQSFKPIIRSAWHWSLCFALIACSQVSGADFADPCPKKLMGTFKLLFSPPDTAESMTKMIDGLKRSQGVDVEFDTTLTHSRARALDSRTAIILGSKAKNELTKAALLHEAVHTTTNFKIEAEQAIKRCAQGVKFRGYIFSAPPGYRPGFRVDEIVAHQKENIYLRSKGGSAKIPYFRRKNLMSYAKDRQERVDQFKIATLEMLALIETRLSLYTKDHPGSIYPFEIVSRPNTPSVSALVMKFENEGANVPLQVDIPVPILKFYGDHSASPEELLALAQKVLGATRRSILHSR